MTTCPSCGSECHVIPLDNSFSYTGAHCTYGNRGTYYPVDYGRPVSDCCEAVIEGYVWPDDGGNEL